MKKEDEYLLNKLEGKKMDVDKYKNIYKNVLNKQKKEYIKQLYDSINYYIYNAAENGEYEILILFHYMQNFSTYSKRSNKHIVQDINKKYIKFLNEKFCAEGFKTTYINLLFVRFLKISWK